jgi:hypothetical protein
MAEIKSTLEIAMEKAKAVEISSKDRERFRREEALSEATKIFQRYTTSPARSGSLEETIMKSGKDASLLRGCLTEIFLNTLDLSHPTERIWDGLQELGLGKTAAFQELFNRIAEDYQKAHHDEAETLGNAMKKSLAEAGISGTAVDPNIEQSVQWKDALERLDQRVSTDLERLRQKIARAIEKRSNSPR